MRDLAGFRDKLASYLRQVGKTEEDLARELYISKGELNKRLNAYYHPRTNRTWRLRDEEAFSIIQALAKWRAITSRQQARELLELIAYPYLHSIDWETRPLNSLRDTPPQPSSQVLSGQNTSDLLQDYYLAPDAMFERMHLEDFVGRVWLEHNLDAYLNEKRRDRGVWLLVGEAGVGKSSFLAHLVRERGYVHLFSGIASGDAYLPLALKSLAIQLIRRFSLAQFIGPDGSLRISTDSPDFLANLLDAASKKLGAEEKLIIVVDALDEAGIVPGGNALGLPKFLPRGVYLILSQRSVPLPITLNIDPAPHRVNLRASEKSNLKDILTYLHRVAATEPIAEQLVKKKQRVKKFARVLSQKSAGNWAYLHYVIDEIRQGQRDLSDLASLPNGLIEYYARYWAGWRHHPKWDTLYAPVLATLAAAFEPISLDTLQAWANVEEGLFPLRRLLKEDWGAFIYEQDGTYRFYHASVREFLAGQFTLETVQPSIAGLLDELRERRKVAHQYIANALFDCALHGRWQETSDDIRFYCLRYLLKHLGILGRADDVYTLIESTSWRRAKIELDPSRYALVQDVEIAGDLSRGALAAGISKQEPVQRIFSLLAPFCAHSLILSVLRSTAANIAPQLLGVLAHLGQTDLALGYADLLNKQDAYQYIAEGLEARGKGAEARDLLQRMTNAQPDTEKASQRSQGREQDEPSLGSVRSLLTRGNADSALKAAERIQSDEEHDEAVSEVAVFLAEKGREEEARNAASRIADPRSQVTCLALISKTLFEKHREALSQKHLDLAIKRAELIQDSFEKAWALIAIIKALVPVTQSGGEGTPERDLALKLAQQAEDIARTIDDTDDQGRTLAGVAECFFDLEETKAGTALIEQMRTTATDMIQKDIRGGLLWMGTYDAPTGIRILEELPHLFVKAGQVEKAQEVMKQAIAEAKHVGREAFGGRMVPEDIVRWMALKGPSGLVKQAAKEVLPQGELESSLWLAAEGLIEREQFEDALALIEDGRIAAYRPGYEVREVLTKAAVWLVRNKQFTRARSISELALDYAQERDETQLAWLFSGIAAGLARSQRPEMAHAAVDLSLQASSSMRRPHAWLLLPDHVNALLEACSADQACQLAEWIIAATKTYWEYLEENEETGIREDWVKLSRLAARAYATAGKLDLAIAVINRFGDEYGRGRRYVHALGEVYVSSQRRGPDGKREELRRDVQEFANILLEQAKEFLSRNSKNAHWNGIMTDMLVTLARIGAASQALELANKIEDPFYRIVSLGTSAYESSPAGKQQEYEDIALNTLAYTKNLTGRIKTVLRTRAITVLARSGRIDLAEMALKEFWFASAAELGTRADRVEKGVQVYDGSTLRLWDDTIAFAQVLTEMIACGSSWSAYVAAELFLKGHFHVWRELGALAPAFGTMNAAEDLWERARKLLVAN